MATVNEKMTAIADNIRAKTGGTEALTLEDMASGVNEVYEKGLSDGNDFNVSEIGDVIRDVTFAPNLFDKDNYEIINNWNSEDIKTTDTGLQWTNLNYPNSGGFLKLKLGLAKDYAGKILTLQTKQFHSRFTNLMLTTADGEDIEYGVTLFAGVPQSNDAYIHRLELDNDGYTDEIVAIRLYYGVIETIVFDEIMVHDHYDAVQPYVPYGYKPSINTQDYSTKISELYNRGVKDQIIEANRLVQGYGTRTDYSYAYYSHRNYGYWNPDTFYPQYNIKGTSFSRAFCGFGANQYASQGLDLSTRLEECGVVLDTSEATTLSSMFHNSTITRIPTLDCRNCVDNGLSSVLGYSPAITVDKMIVKDTLMFSNSFGSAYALTNIIFEGAIGQDISFEPCPLSVDSMKNIIDHLVDYTAIYDPNTDEILEYKHTITFNASAFEKLEAEGETADWITGSCTWAQLIDNKKWNLVKA